MAGFGRRLKSVLLVMCSGQGASRLGASSDPEISNLLTLFAIKKSKKKKDRKPRIPILSVVDYKFPYLLFDA